jgi:hypothetical protein
MGKGKGMKGSPHGSMGGGKGSPHGSMGMGSPHGSMGMSDDSYEDDDE